MIGLGPNGEFILDIDSFCRYAAFWRQNQEQDRAVRNDPVALRARLMGIVSECGEAYNATRPEKGGSHEKLLEELADIFIRWAGMVGTLYAENKIEAIIRDKMEAQ